MSPADSVSPTGHRTDWWIFAAYLAIAIALTWPLVPQIATGVPNDLGDPVLNTWILWWNAVAVPFSDAWWNAPAYYPTAGVLTFSEHLLGLSPISTPIYWLTGNIQLGYNVALFVSFPLSAFFAYLLCKDLTGRRDAAFIGGLIFGFTPYRIVQLPHIQVLCSYWMPIALLGLHRYLREPRTRWLVLFAGGWLMQALSNGYYMIFLSVLIACWLLWFLPWRQWRTVAGVAIAGLIAGLPLIPIVLRYRQVHQFLGLKRSVDEMMLYSADITSLFDHTNRLVVWRYMPAFHRPEGELFPGVAGVLLVAIGLWVSRTRAASAAAGSPTPPRRRNRTRIALWVLTPLFLAGAASAYVSPWETKIWGLEISATHLHKPLTLALICGLALLFTSARVRRAMRGRTTLGFYILAAALMWLFSFGPKPTFMGVQALYQGPYNWLAKLPGIDTLRTPARFHMAAVLCLSVAAAICFARIVAVLRTRRVVFTAAIIVIALADTWIWRFPMEPAPKPWPVQASELRGPVVEVPLMGLGNDVEAMYRSMFTGNAVVNGYSGFGPPWYDAVGRGLATQDTDVLQELSARGVKQLLLNATLEGTDAWVKYLATRPDIRLIADDGAHKLYALPAAKPFVTRLFGPAVRIAGLAASINAKDVGKMTDGDLTTRWETGPQKGVEVLTIDLGGPTAVAAIMTSLGPFTRDAPRQLVIECSDDGQAWTDVWHGGGAAGALRAGFDDPVRMGVTFDIGDRTTRFLRLRQIGSDETFYWTIAELAVLAPPVR